MNKIITVPFGWLIGFLYELTNNYGLAIIIFTFIVQLVLLPITAKSKKSMMKMSRIQPRVQEIQQKYANDKQKQNEAIQQLQKEEGATMGCGGCLWSLVPLLILIPLLQVIRDPIVYILGESADVAAKIVETIKTAAPELFSGRNNYYEQVVAAQAIPQYAEQLKAAIPGISVDTLQGINFNFLGINLTKMVKGNEADLMIWIFPALAVLSTVASSYITKLQTSKNSSPANEQAQSMSDSMMTIMPIMTAIFTYTMPVGMSLYWFVSTALQILQQTVINNIITGIWINFQCYTKK